jgi:hypothetical protein
MKGTQFSTLRWGALAIGVGIGWLLGWTMWMQVNYDMSTGTYHHYVDFSSILFATTSLCAGIALIIVYFIERKAVKSKKEE